MAHHKPAHQPTVLKRRTTLTLPAGSLRQAQRLADSRRVNLSTVIAEVVAAGLQLEDARQRADQILVNCRKAFADFSDDEIAVLDGIMLKPVAAGSGAPRRSGRNAGPGK